MSKTVYRQMLLRQRFCKRVLLLCIVFVLSFYSSILLFGGLKTPSVLKLTHLNRCPACYGVSVCPELYADKISLEEPLWPTNLFNVKNIYHGYTNQRKVILKKLAYDEELRSFDDNLCKALNLTKNCKPIDMLNISALISSKMVDVVRYNPLSTEPRKGLIFCPYAHKIHEFLAPILGNKKEWNFNVNIANVWTMLTINAEPIIFQIIPKSKGWRVPAFGGVCGRLELVAYEGESLSALSHIAWYRKLKIAKRILDMAMDFTFKHDQYRFYFYDWSADNIVVNGKDEVFFVDLEDVIVLDKHITPKNNLPNWYQRYLKDDNHPGYTFSIDLICKHHLSDHNVFSACYILVGDENAFLFPIPKEFPSTTFVQMLNHCLKGPNRFHAATLLQRYITDQLSKDSVAGFGAVR